MHLEGHINPLMVLPRGQGVKAVDALVVFRDQADRMTERG
jgi:succinyl-CoA synthetase beta subunit